MTSRITRKEFLASAAGLAVAMPAIWRPDRAFAQGALTLKLGHPDTPLHPTQAVATKFSELVAAKTGGAIRIQVFSGGQLGSEVNIVSGMQTGIVDMVFHTTGFLESFFPRIQVLDLPFLFRDAKTAEAVLDGPIGQGLLGDMPAKGIYGFVSRGLKNANIPVWTSWLLGQGLETIDPSGKLLTDTPEAIWAAEYYRDLNKNYAPPGTIGFNWNECQTTFMQGRAAMWLDGIGFTAPVEDPKVSRVVGKVGYGVTPPGPKAHHSATFADGLGIAATSKKKQAAWLYIQWATNKVNQLRFLKEGGGAPARNSVYSDRETVTSSKFGPQWFDCILESAKIGRPGLPVIIPVQEFRDVFGVALTNTLTGADPATELKKATEAFKPILEASEKG